MKILLPPSEGKAFGKSSSHFALEDLSFTELNGHREKVLKQLVKSSQSKSGLEIFGLTEGLKSELKHNANIASAPTSAAIEIYEGVVYQNIDFGSLGTRAQRNFNNQALIVSSLFGILRPFDMIPHYRLSGNVKLPSVGVISTFWSQKLHSLFDSDELILDCRSGTYEKFWKPNHHHNYLKIKVMQYDSAKGQKLAVSHFNKATKGQVTRTLVSSRVKLVETEQVAHEIARAGWEVELTCPAGVPTLEVMMR